MPGPFSDRTVGAVSACTRALAPALDAEPALARANAATLGALRAAGDRLAVQQRHHQSAIHREHQPEPGPAADAYAALELARLDALGVAWLAGIARNLLAHPGADEDGLRWLAFETFSGQAAPATKHTLVKAVRAALPAAMLAELGRLAPTLTDQARFAASASAWSQRAARYLPVPATPDASRQLLLPRREVKLRKLPARGNPGGTAAPLTKRSPDARQDDADNQSSGNTGATVARVSDYRAYTTAHDRVVHAATLADRTELLQLRKQLESELGSVRAVVARLAKRLMRVLMARQARAWRFDQEDGLLDASRLATFIASHGAARPFKQEIESTFPRTVVTLLIDHSGSMRGRPMLIAAITVEIFAQVLERCGVHCEILGFTTREWDGGEPAREWATNGYPENPGRLNALEHIVIKGADVPWRRARAALGLFLRHEMLKENIDGEAVRWAHGRLLARSEPRRILIVVSDGTPMDEATMAANGHDYLDGHLSEVIEEIETRSPVQLAAIGIGHDVSRFYQNATTIARIDQLGPALTSKLMALLST